MNRLIPFLVLLALAAAADARPASFDHRPRLEARVGIVGLFDDDLDATYGVIPGGELGVSWRISSGTRFGLALGYGSREGDPFHDTPDFAGGDLSRLRVVPLSAALRFDMTSDERLRIVGGLSLQVAWIEERAPTGETPSGLQSLDGRAAGFLASIGPEWRLAGGKHLVSLDFALGGVAGEVQEGTRRWDVDLRGLHLRCGYAVALGASEVRP